MFGLTDGNLNNKSDLTTALPIQLNSETEGSLLSINSFLTKNVSDITIKYLVYIPNVKSSFASSVCYDVIKLNFPNLSFVFHSSTNFVLCIIGTIST
jgi:hypothetical protein